MRDDFSAATKVALAQRVNYNCSRPGCGAPTAGPQVDPAKALNVGVAAHITAASEGGPRFDPSLTQEERSGATNGVWLCQTCAKLVDNDERRFSADELRHWKAEADDRALGKIGKTVVPEAESILPALPERLRAPRSIPLAEISALNKLYENAKFYMRVVRLIEDIGKLPENAIVNIARSTEYERAKGALLSRFGEDYQRFVTDIESAVDLLEAVIESESQTDAKATGLEITEAAREVATTVETLVAWAQDRRNEPVSLGTLYERPKACNEARESAKKMTQLVARRIIALEK
jgi:hypothetical protein